MHWRRLVKDIGGNQNIGGIGVNWWNHRHFWIIGG